MEQTRDAQNRPLSIKTDWRNGDRGVVVSWLQGTFFAAIGFFLAYYLGRILLSM
jgi:hypothetical protein